MAKKENQVSVEEKLIVKNFGPLKNIDIVLNKYTLFIGPQGKGKSTLAKLIAIFRDYNFLLDSFVFNSSDTSSNFEYFETYNIKNYFVDTEIDDRFNTFLEYTSPDYRITYSQGKFEFYKSDDFERILKFEEEAIDKLKEDERLKEIFNLERIKPGFSELFSNHAVSTKYIPAERFFTSLISDSLSSLIFRDIYLPPFIHKFNSYFQNARDKIKELNVHYLSIRYTFEDNIDKLFFDKTKFLKLSESASGQQAIIPLLLVLSYFEKNNLNNSFIIEEPELNLFPETQKELVKDISSYTWFAGNSAVVTTHSPYILSSFSLLLFAHQVAQKDYNSVNKIISEKSWINPNKFVSYYVANGACKSIFNKETGLIGENELDEVSLSIGDEFDRLMEIYREKSA